MKVAVGDSQHFAGRGVKLAGQRRTPVRHAAAFVGQRFRHNMAPVVGLRRVGLSDHAKDDRRQRSLRRCVLSCAVSGVLKPAPLSAADVGVSVPSAPVAV